METKEFVKRLSLLFKNIDCSDIVYVNNKTPVSPICRLHGPFKAIPSNLLRKHGCPACAGVAKLTQNQFLARAKSVHGDVYDYSGAVYVRYHDLLAIGCRKHNTVFYKSAANHLRGQGCPKCSREQQTEQNRKHQDRFIKEANLAHSSKYDYSLAVYTGNKNKVQIICPSHGVFEQVAGSHLSGHGCPKCSVISVARQQTKSETAFIKQAEKEHAGYYDYSLVKYTGDRVPVTIVCKIHGIFSQQPHDHLRGSGCPQCSFVRRGVASRADQAHFLEKAQQALQGKACDLSKSVYVSSGEKVTVTCPIHGQFLKSPDNLYRGQGCPVCSKTSQGESELAEWIKSLNVRVLQRDRIIIAPLELDIVLPDLKLAIEYNGDYWHSVSVKESFAFKSKMYHRLKYAEAAKTGYTLLSVWESDWTRRRVVVEHWLRHKLGKAATLCFARQCSIKIVNHADARVFYAKNHLQGSCVPCEHFGLYAADESLVACMSFSSILASRSSGRLSNEWNLVRFALAGKIPGAASKLFKHAVKALSVKSVITYSDNTYADGGVYNVLGFVKEADLPPDYRVWHPQYGIKHKSFWQRSQLPRRLKELGLDTNYDPKTDPRTEFDIEDFAGCRHVWDCGKVRWRWTLK